MKEIICKRWVLSNNIKAIVLYPFIFYNGQPTAEIVRHEYEHVNQIRKNGIFKFYFKYLKYHFSKGYNNNPFEIEARRISKRG